MNKFQSKYKWSSFNIIFNKTPVLKNLSYDEVCEWLKLNKRHLFNHFIERAIMNEFWDAENFLRYETEI